MAIIAGRVAGGKPISLISAANLGRAQNLASDAKQALMNLYAGDREGLGDRTAKLFYDLQAKQRRVDARDAWRKFLFDIKMFFVNLRVKLKMNKEPLLKAAGAMFTNPLLGFPQMMRAIGEAITGKMLKWNLDALKDPAAIKQTFKDVTTATGTFGTALAAAMGLDGQPPGPLLAISGRIESKQLDQLKNISAGIGTLVVQGSRNGWGLA